MMNWNKKWIKNLFEQQTCNTWKKTSKTALWRRKKYCARVARAFTNTPKMIIITKRARRVGNCWWLPLHFIFLSTFFHSIHSPTIYAALLSITLILIVVVLLPSSDDVNVGSIFWVDISFLFYLVRQSLLLYVVSPLQKRAKKYSHTHIVQIL